MELDPLVLARRAEEARARTHLFVDHLDDEQMIGPKHVLNPLLWEIGHVAWFMERWALRRDGSESIHPKADSLYDSAAIPNAKRWDLDLLPREEVYAYMRGVLDLMQAQLASPDVSEEDAYHAAYSIAHEQMHDEAFTRTLHWHGYAPPPDERPEVYRTQAALARQVGGCPGDVELAGGTFRLGSERDAVFVFDNEKWAHEVELAPFVMSRAVVSQDEYLAFVEDGGYENDALWCEEGRAWRGERRHPHFWRKQDGIWQVRRFDTWEALTPHRPVSNVNWFEANAYCRWAGRRLPTEAEWEYAASMHEGRKLTRPWAKDSDDLNFDWRAMGCVDVGANEEHDLDAGCRQMMGNVWEWTADTFAPFQGFETDPYAEYSAPWFGDQKVLKGGSWACFRWMHSTTYRNFAQPWRQDHFAGFRTCACT